jgi:hypothetical protein
VWLVVLVLVSCAKAKTSSIWKWFVTHADELRAEKDVRTTFERVGAELKKSHPDVVAEIAVDGEERTLPDVREALGHSGRCEISNPSLPRPTFHTCRRR